MRLSSGSGVGLDPAALDRALAGERSEMRASVTAWDKEWFEALTLWLDIADGLYRGHLARARNWSW